MGIACLVTGVIVLVLFLYELKFGRVGALKVDIDANSNIKGLSSSDDERKPLLGDNGSVQNHIDV
jgi:hypothetical protein